MKVNKRFLSVLGASLALHAGVLFFAPGISPGGAAEKLSPAAAGKAFSLYNIAARPEVPAPRKPRRAAALPAAAVKESSPDGIITETRELPPGEDASIGVPAAVFSSGEARESLFTRYAGIVRQRIDESKEYPYAARRQAQEGFVRVRFTLSRDGRLVGEPVVEKGCRYRALNAAALEAVRRAGPYPAFPGELPEESLSFSLTISFSLRERGS
jgi:protein TonB